MTTGPGAVPRCLVQHRPIRFFSSHCGLGDAHGTPEHRRGNAELVQPRIVDEGDHSRKGSGNS
jgi:hypothetical protein